MPNFYQAGPAVISFEGIHAVVPSDSRARDHEIEMSIFFKNGKSFSLATSYAEAQRLTDEFAAYLSEREKITKSCDEEEP
jgi:hypothetical protein